MFADEVFSCIDYELDCDIRLAAVNALTYVKCSSRKYEALIHCLQDDESDVRAEAVRCVGGKEIDAIKTCFNALRCEQSLLRSMLMQCCEGVDEMIVAANDDVYREDVVNEFYEPMIIVKYASEVYVANAEDDRSEIMLIRCLNLLSDANDEVSDNVFVGINALAVLARRETCSDELKAAVEQFRASGRCCHPAMEDLMCAIESGINAVY